MVEMLSSPEPPVAPAGMVMLPITSELEFPKSVMTVVADPNEVVLNRHASERDDSSWQLDLPPPFSRGLRVFEVCVDFVVEVCTPDTATDLEGLTNDKGPSAIPIGEREDSTKRDTSPIVTAADELGLVDRERDREMD